MMKDGDTLIPQYQYGLSEIATQKIDPIEKQVNTLLGRLNKTLASVDTVVGTDGENLRAMFKTLKTTINTMNSAVGDVNNMVKASAGDIKKTIENVASITENIKNSNAKITALISNVSALTDSLKNADIAGTITETKAAIAEVNKMMTEINEGDGTAHQLIYNDELIKNVNSMLEETERLIVNIKEHPKRYLHFAVFGKKDKGIKLDATDEKKLEKLLDEQP